MTPTMSINTAKNRRWYADPSAQVFAAMAVGVALGFAAPGVAEQMKPLGDIFLRLIRMAIGPVIFLTVVTGVSGMGSLKKLGKVGGLALLYFEVLTTIALVLGLILGNVLVPGAGMNATVTSSAAAEAAQLAAKAHSGGVGTFLIDIFPDNIVRSFAEGQLVQIVFFSVLFGIALSMLGDYGKPVDDFLQRLTATLFRLIDLVMKFAPFGAFGAIAFTTGRYGPSALGSLGYFVLCTYIAYVIFVVCVLGVVARLAGLNLWRLAMYLREELLIVFGTSTTESVLLPTMEKLEALGCARGVVGLVMPSGYSFNLDGAAIYLSVAVLFIAQAYHVPLDVGQQVGILLILVVTSKGGAGVAGAALVVLGATLSATNVLPVEGLALLFGVDRIVNIGRAMTNLLGNALATVVVARFNGDFDTGRALQTYRNHFSDPAIQRI